MGGDEEVNAEFALPPLSFQAVGFVAVGCVLAFAKLGKEQRRIYALSEIVGKMGLQPSYRLILELTIFVLLGSLVAWAIVQPMSPAQAVAAGLGWTGILTDKKT